MKHETFEKTPLGVCASEWRYGCPLRALKVRKNPPLRAWLLEWRYRSRATLPNSDVQPDTNEPCQESYDHRDSGEGRYSPAKPGLKGSIGEGPNHSNHSNHSNSFRIGIFRNFSLENSKISEISTFSKLSAKIRQNFIKI